MNLNDKTTLPLIWVFMAIPFAIGAMFWLTSVSYSVEAQAAKLTGLEIKWDKKEEILIQIKEDVAVIKQRLESQNKERKSGQ
jgi:hypothetical protein